MAKGKILIIDDEPGIVKSVGRILVKAGYKVISAMDAMRATQVAIKERPDLIIMDLKMPAGSGHTVADRLKDNYNTAAIPIIILSGSGDEEDVKKTEAWGAAKFINKPFESKELLNSVNEILTSTS